MVWCVFAFWSVSTYFKTAGKESLHLFKWNDLCSVVITLHLNVVYWRRNSGSCMCLVVLFVHPSYLENRCDPLIQSYTHTRLWEDSFVDLYLWILDSFLPQRKWLWMIYDGKLNAFLWHNCFDCKQHHYRDHQRAFQELLLYFVRRLLRCWGCLTHPTDQHEESEYAFMGKDSS